MEDNSKNSEISFVEDISRRGSRAWANRLLKLGIAECQNDKRAWAGVIVQVLVYIGELKEQGYWWQSRRLRNHLHLAMKRRSALSQAEGLTPREKGGDSF